MGDTWEEAELVFPLDIPEARGKESIVHAKERPPSKVKRPRKPSLGTSKALGGRGWGKGEL